MNEHRIVGLVVGYQHEVSGGKMEKPIRVVQISYKSLFFDDVGFKTLFYVLCVWC